jgi:dehydrogenase/reductase SDR family member 1
MRTVTGKVAVVTGSSRGVGKGIALGLGEAGATVYVTGRTVEGASPDGFPGTIGETARQVTEMGGQGVAVRCDHRNDADVEALFARVEAEQGRLDILVNNAWGGYEHMVEQASEGVWEFTWLRPFWEQPLWRWDAAFAGGVRAAYTASRLGVPLMLPQRSGLVVNVSYWASQKYLGNVAYGAAKAAVEKMARDMAHELQPHDITVVALYPGLVRTEAVMNSAEHFDLSNSESPQFQGRAVAALAADSNVLVKTGQVLVSAALALEYGFTDIDGKQPRPLTLEEA